MTPERIHPAQRYDVKLDKDYEYLGAIEGYDVLWIPYQGRILLKCSNEVGDNWRIQLPYKNTRMGYGADPITKPTAEQIDLAVAMATCFAQAGREDLTGEEHAAV